MRRVLALGLLICLLSAAHLAAPLWLALDTRRAVLEGDRAVLQARVDWPSVRNTLKESLATVQASRQARIADAPVSMWGRMKARAAPTRYIESLIDSHVTADGVIALAAAQRRFRSYIGADPLVASMWQPTALADRMQKGWASIVRLSYPDLTTLELEVRDRRVETRSYRAKIAFRDWRWRIVEVRVVTTGT